MKQKKLIFNFFVNRNWKKLTNSRKRTKILADNRKSHHPIETLTKGFNGQNMKKLKISKLLPDFRYLQKLDLNTGDLGREASSAEHHR